jgi:uncharacterized RDD family membrane protein YckC
MAGEIMKTSTLRRFMPLIALMLCATTLIVHARGATPDAAAVPAAVAPAPVGKALVAPAPPVPPAAAPTSAASSPADESEPADWESDNDQNGHHRHPGRHAWRDHHGNDLVSIGHDSSLPQGQKADSVVSILGSSTSEGEADDVVSVLGNTRVTGKVSDSAVAVFGNTYIDSKVDGDVVAVFGNVELGPNAEIGGDVAAVGGKVVRDPAAVTHGDVRDVFAGNLGGLGWASTWVQHCLFYGRPLALVPGLGWAWSLALTFLALYICLALLFRAGLTECVRTFENHPGHTVLAALIAMLLTPVLVVLLCITVIGIAAVPFVVLGLFLAGLFGKAVMLAWVGRRVVSERAAGTLDHPAFAVLVGGLIVLLLYVVPVLGFFVYKLLGFLGLGAVVYTLILGARARRADELKAGGTAASTDATRPGTAPMTGATSPAGAAPSTGTAPPGGPTPPPAAAAVSSASASAPITAALARAGFWIRMGALLIDVLLIGIATHVLHPLFHLHLLGLAIYGAVMWKLRGTTVGGIVFDLRVVRLDGREIDWETAIIRALSCFLSLAVAGLGFFWIAFDRDHQAWHDKIAGTVVVRVPKGVSLV